MASISHHKIKGYRVHWRFTVRSGPRTGESVTGSLLLGRCSKAAAKAHLRKVEAWEASVKTGERVADASWEEVRDAWLRERELIYTEQTLARAKRVLDMYERWRKERELPCQTIEQVARRQDVTNWRNHRLDGQAGRKTVANDCHRSVQNRPVAVESKPARVDNHFLPHSVPFFKLALDPVRQDWVALGSRDGAAGSSCR